MSQVRILSPRPFSRRTATAASAPSFLVGLRARSGPVDRPLSETPVKLPERHAISLAEEGDQRIARRSEEHTSELQSLMRISYAVFCLNKKKKKTHASHV